jgi:hypothetical protein
MNMLRAVLIFTVLILCLFVPASAWVSGYDYRMPIEINNTGDTLAHYEYDFTVDTASLISVGKMQSNGSDCCIANLSDILQSFWNETAFNLSDTKIWVNASSLGNVSNTTHYFYYGKSGASSLTNGTATFESFDNFSGEIIDAKYLTNWTKSGSNPLQSKTCQNWLVAVYSNYNNEDKIYIFEQRNAHPSNNIECWSFTKANASTPAQWTDHGVIFTGAGAHDDGHIEPHGIIFETQSMSDAREGVGVGLGTPKWRMYYCGKESGVGSEKYSANFAYASESNLTNWTAYASNPVYDHSGSVGYADSKVCIYDDKVWMHHCEYGGAGPCDPSFFSVSDDGISNWTDTSRNWATEETVLGTLVPFSTGILLSGTNAVDTACDAYFTTDGENKATYSGNPILSGGGGAWDDNIYWYTIPVDKNGSANLNSAGTYYLYYIGHLGGVYKLGVATSTTLTAESDSIIDTDKWSLDGTPSVSDGIATVVGNGMHGKNDYGMSHSCRFKAKAYSPVGGGNWDAYGLFGWDDSMDTSTPYENYLMRSTYSTLVALSAEAYSPDLGSAMLDSWATYEIKRNSTSHEFLIDGVSKHTENSPHTGVLSPTIWSGSAKEKIEMDWVFVRKCADIEPSTSLGVEEGAPNAAPNITLLSQTPSIIYTNLWHYS